MSNYQETQISGTAHKRAVAITIQNPFQGIPTIQFHEELVIQTGDRYLKELDGDLSIVANMGKSVPLLNPVTGEATGHSMTMGEGYAFIYSVYIQAALERDAALPEPEPEE